MSDKYKIETFNLEDGDVLILHVSEYCDISDIQVIHKEMSQLFPNNKILIANENILKHISIIKKQDNKYDPVEELEKYLGEFNL